MARAPNEQIRANEFRLRAAEVLKDPDWLDEGVRHWLQKELDREAGHVYSQNEHAALARIIAAGTLFDGWDGYTVPILLAAAHLYKADGVYEDERLLDEIEARSVTRLRLGEMSRLVGFCRNIAGVPLAPFKPKITTYEYAE
jgi:hypothetical protein